MTALRDLVRMLERTRGTYWQPTPAAKEDTPPPAPESWQMLVEPEVGGYAVPERDAELWSQTFRRTGNEARTWRGGQTPRVTVSFVNISQTERLSFGWIDSRSLNPTEKPWGELGPGARVEQHTFVNHAWVLRLPGGAAVAGYVPTEPGHHVVGVGRHRDMPSLADFQRLAGDHVQRAREASTAWRNTAEDAAANARAGAPLPPRPAQEQWAVVAWPPISGMEVPEADAEVWAGTHRSVGMEGHRWRGAQTPQVRLVFVNCGAESVAVSWLDIHNNMRERWDYNVAAGQSANQDTYIYHAFVFRDGAGRAVGGYVPMEVGDAAKQVVFFGPRASLPQGDDLERRALPHAR